jgi:hypothetical protein
LRVSVRRGMDAPWLEYEQRVADALALLKARKSLVQSIDAESCPTPDPAGAFVTTSIEPVSSPQETDAAFGARAPLLAVAEPSQLLELLSFGALGAGCGRVLRLPAPEAALEPLTSPRSSNSPSGDDLVEHLKLCCQGVTLDGAPDEPDRRTR